MSVGSTVVDIGRVDDEVVVAGGVAPGALVVVAPDAVVPDAVVPDVEVPDVAEPDAVVPDAVPADVALPVRSPVPDPAQPATASEIAPSTDTVLIISCFILL
ncbi:hypothetical protein [Nakamurella deserti]|uniref:hypothetical protein n=1 Tax=Nakamurella deserti TaxID=2164074 RepID=UPI0013008B91|nr:hypothetical protein [Nakamurella deserti]